MGIVFLGLAPDFLDKNENIITAHKKCCNSFAELSLEDSCRRLKTIGVTKLPSYLPKNSLKCWE